MTPANAKSALSATQIITHLAQVEGWQLHGDGPNVAIEKTYRFGGFLQTLAFVNAVAYLAEQQQHHPEMVVGFGRCTVRFNTHDVRGISRRDFECAALVDQLAPAKP